LGKNPNLIEEKTRKLRLFLLLLAEYKMNKLNVKLIHSKKVQKFTW
jgi:hypothetical protein